MCTPASHREPGGPGSGRGVQHRRVL